MPILVRVLVLMLVVVTLAACGKKSSPSPPTDVPNTYPMQYPSH